MNLSNNNNLIRHMRMHAGEKPYNCNKCDMNFLNKSNLISHMRTHAVKKPYHRNQCFITFLNNSNLINYMWIHPVKKPYHCNQCDNSFSDNYNLFHKRQNFTDISGITLGKSHINVFNVIGILNQKFTFAENSDLIAHMRIHIGEKT